MLGIETTTVTLAVLWVCVGSTLLSVLFLWLEFHSAQQLSRSLSGILAAVFFGSAVILWFDGRSPDVFAPFVILATLCLGVRVMYSGRVRQFAKRLAEPKLIWGLLLLICGVASGYLALRINSSDSDKFVGRFSETKFHDVPDIKAVTDAGREIDLFHFDESDDVAEIERGTLAIEMFDHQIIRLGSPDNVSNCHGWIFTGGQYGIHGREVERILLDNGYVEVPDVLAGDLVIYRTPEGEIEHTDVVRLMGADGLILVESKWGAIGVYIHPPEATPFGSNFSFYRSPRKGHLLKLPPVLPTVIHTPIASTTVRDGLCFLATGRETDRSICRGTYPKRQIIQPNRTPF
ncbi:MAG: hypothetical protein HZA46_14050 [Planctomycetales bacterium]|nr:hypothetical protein [Planctomycetales bacterium]